jgi:hypothetical protein
VGAVDENAMTEPESVQATPGGADPLEARDTLARLIRARAPRREIEKAADQYIAAIKQRAQATGRKLPVPSQAFIIRWLS